MNKVFKASIIAATLATAFGANAADLAINKVANVTNEAAAAKVAIPAITGAIVTFYNREELSAGDIVTLAFPFGTALTGGTVETGTGVGSFDLAFTAADPVAKVGPIITLTVKTGSPVLNNSKTDVALIGYTPVSGNLVYTAKDGFSGVAKDLTGQNSVALTAKVAQEVATVETAFDGYVQRLARGAYVTSKGDIIAQVKVVRADATVKADVESESFTLTADRSLVRATSGADIELAVPQLLSCADGKGVTFKTGTGAVCSDNTTPATVIATGTIGCAVTATDCTKDTITFNTFDTATKLLFVNDTKLKADVANVAFYLAPVSDEDLPLASFKIDRDVAYDYATALEYKYLKGEAFGQLQLDASVINVPYLPVGLGLTPNVEIANAGATDAEIQIEAFDQNGVAYPAATLPFKAGKKAVTKVSEAAIEKAFGLAAGSKKKLSVTFVIDANAADITLAPYYREGESRVNVLSDQYKK